jgi:hypothetical protein
MIKKISRLIYLFLFLQTFSCDWASPMNTNGGLMPVSNGELYEYINVNGKIIINPQFKTASVFRNGLALVSSPGGYDTKLGFIDQQGHYVINPQYVAATVFNEGIAWVLQEKYGDICAIDKKGQTLFTTPFAKMVKLYKDDLAAFSIDGKGGEEKWGFLDKTGKIAINPQFSSAGSFSEGKCPVSFDNERWGYIDKEGHVLINPQFDFAEQFNDGLAIVRSGRNCGVVDKNGKFVINPQFEEMIFDEDLFLFKQSGKWGWCDRKGKILINPQFDLAFPFKGSKATSIKYQNAFGFINKKGEIIISPQYSFALPFNKSSALVEINGDFGMIDIKGSQVIVPQFTNVAQDYILSCISGESVYENLRKSGYSESSDMFRKWR